MRRLGHQIVQRHAAKVVLTVRNGEPISPRVQDMEGGQFDRLDLQTLSGDETTMLVSAALRGHAVVAAPLGNAQPTRRESLTDSFALGAASGTRAPDGPVLTSPTTWEPL